MEVIDILEKRYITAEEKDVSRAVVDLEECKTLADISNKHLEHYVNTTRDLLKMDFNKVKELYKKGILKSYKKRRDDFIKEITAIRNAPDLISVDLSIEWKTSKTWGANPKCTATIHYQDTYGSRIDQRDGSVSGCGYDKESAVIAKVLNSSPIVLKALMCLAEKDPTHQTYGWDMHGNGIPSLSGGGVGVSSLMNSFERAGYDFKAIAHGKSFDVYTITKKEKK